MAARHVLMPKGPTAHIAGDARDAFDRDAVLARLFALPVQTNLTPGRRYPIDTPLGRLMILRGLKVNDVARWPGAPNHRLLSDYLAQRRPIPPKAKGVLARGLGVDVRLL